MSEDRTQQLPDGGVGLILSRLDSIDVRMTALEEKVDRRLQETRPIWEQVLSSLTQVETRLTGVETRLTGVETRLEAVETRLTGVETRLGAVEEEVYTLNRKFRVFSVDIVKLQDKQEDLTERVRRIESEHAQ